MACNILMVLLLHLPWGLIGSRSSNSERLRLTLVEGRNEVFRSRTKGSSWHFSLLPSSLSPCSLFAAVLQVKRLTFPPTFSISSSVAQLYLLLLISPWYFSVFPLPSFPLWSAASTLAAGDYDKGWQQLRPFSFSHSCFSSLLSRQLSFINATLTLLQDVYPHVFFSTKTKPHGRFYISVTSESFCIPSHPRKL